MTLTRRTALWSVPAITVAAAAPAFATSEPVSTPTLVCDYEAWRTNYGHTKKHHPGTHMYHVKVRCTSRVRQVWIAGEKAFQHPSGTWTVVDLRGGVHQYVRVLTDSGLLPDRRIRFQPRKD